METQYIGMQKRVLCEHPLIQNKNHGGMKIQVRHIDALFHFCHYFTNILPVFKGPVCLRNAT